MPILSDSVDSVPCGFLLFSFLVGLFGAPRVAPAQHPTAVTSIVNSAQDTTLEVNSNGSLLAPGSYLNDGSENDSIAVEGAGTRMMWYPAKAAFRAGRVGAASGWEDVWDANNIGVHSVAFGVDTRASGNGATAMGDRTRALGDGATAMGNRTIASGNGAMAAGFGTVASGSQATAMGARTEALGLQATAMGFETIAATGSSLSIGLFNSANMTEDNSLFVVGNGSSGDRSDALILDFSGNLTIDGTFTDELGTFAGHFQVSEAGSDQAGHAVLVENAGGQGADALAIQTGADDQPNDLNNFLSFYDGNGTAIGAIEGDGSGGITTRSGGADFAEELPVINGEEAPESASLVGVTGDTVTLDTQGAERLMITSTAPIMTGNATTGTTADDDRRVAVAFVGQVPVKVRGEADVGDLIVASGENDGTARAVSPSAYRRSLYGPIAGQAWSEKTSSEVGRVTAAVGLGSGGALAQQVEALRTRVQQLETEHEEIDRLKERIAQVESGTGGFFFAGRPGVFLALTFGAVLGAGLLWRRRTP